MIRKLLAFVIIGVIAVSCDEPFETDQPTVPVTPNHSPYISSMSSSKTEVGKNGTVSFSCQASDPDADSLRYLWTSNAGEFIGDNTTNPTTWKAPDFEGLQIIKVTVSDGAIEKSDSISVVVR